MFRRIKEMFKLFIQLLKFKRVSIPIVLILAAILIWWGYQVNWTNFQAQNLWDWMELLIIPLVLGIGALLFRREESKVEHETTLDKQRQEALMTYFDRMENLLLKHELRRSEEIDEVRSVARARTLSVLRNMDGLRKRYALQFLYESNLISISNPIIYLEGADLEGADLEGAYLIDVRLRGSNLKGAKLGEANLKGANLNSTNLQGANLDWANLQGADLNIADFTGANLNTADLRGANLISANLDTANLEGAYVNPNQIVDKSYLLNTIMPDGKKYEEWVKMGKPDWNNQAEKWDNDEKGWDNG